MTVIMFQNKFGDKIRSGSKRHTIRAPRKRPIKSGDSLSLRRWTGRPYGSPQEVLIETTAKRVVPIRIDDTFDGAVITVAGIELRNGQRERLAIDDGFGSERELLEWFSMTHGLPFEGVLIEWVERSEVTQ